MYCTREKDYCAHGRKSELEGIKTCYNKFELLLIAEKIEAIEGKRLYFKRDGNIGKLWKDIAAYMKKKHSCLDELCWVETLKLQKIEESAFKPKLPNEWLECNKDYAPNNNCMNTWLSNLEIDEVLTQFQQNVPYFDYLGAVPIDFANLSNKKINSFSVKEAIKNKKTKIGMVFNTDPSTRGGQHWICAFVDLKNKEINFFDSYGSKGVYPKEVHALLIKIQNEAKLYGIQLKIKKNIVKHQEENSECGVYCLKFISDRLERPFEKIVNQRIPDELVNKERWRRFFRTEYCRPEKIKF